MTTRAFALLTPIWALLLGSPAHAADAGKPAQPPAEVKEEHSVIGVAGAAKEPDTSQHTQHPGAQWFGDAGLGLFIHWGIASVRAMNISWPMFDRGTGAAITPDEYWTQAKDFNPKKYDPDKWIK